MQKIIINGEIFNISKEKYLKNGTPAITIYCKDGGSIEPYLDLTVNFHGASTVLGNDEIAVKTWSENEPFVNILLQSGFFQDTGKRVKISSFVEAHIWKMTKEITGDGLWMN